MRNAGEVLVLLAAVCLIGGCLGAPAPLSTGGGITPIDLPEPPGAYTLTEALLELDLLGAEGGLNVTGTTVHQVLASGVDLDGQATSWVLGLRDGEEVRWLAFGITGWKEITLPAPLPAEEVDITAIIPPEDLLRSQDEVLSPVMNRLGADTVEIALAEGVYSVTIHSDAGLESFVFQADSGEVIA
ncbi:MAG: hypothetical protein GX216_00305 [Methanomicrobiales archaeon]|jgi:hypothetical protein|nr:hypothetical protein [Methanomicrobiales archaeon]